MYPTMTRDLFDRLFDLDKRNSALVPYSESLADRGWNPAVDVHEDGERLLFLMELPGVNPEDIDVELKGDTLTIKGERKHESEEKRKGFIRVERSYGKFQRAFTLGIPVKADELKAAYRSGILEVSIPKADALKPKKVLVTAE